jgi:hypothetical protein
VLAQQVRHLLPPAAAAAHIGKVFISSFPAFFHKSPVLVALPARNWRRVWKMRSCRASPPV